MHTNDRSCHVRSKFSILDYFRYANKRHINGNVEYIQYNYTAVLDVNTGEC